MRAALFLLATAFTTLVSAEPAVEVLFSPYGGCTDRIVSEIDGATGKVRVQAYVFTSAPIAKAIVSAHRRGLDVLVILDKSQRTEKYSSADFTAHAGVPTWIDSRHAIAHNKIIIVDDRIVITGSFNFTNAAEERNAENLVLIREPRAVKRYIDNFAAHLAHSQRYTGK